MTLEERFRAKFDEGDPWDCWDWKPCRSEQEYGRIRHEGRSQKAHRVAFELSRGRLIGDGLEIMHLCDRPCCVNPVHLEEGTHLQNMMDSLRKGRLIPPPQTPEAQAKQRANTPRGDEHWFRKNPGRWLGEQNINARLNSEKVRQIRRLRQEGLSFPAIARRFGVTHRTIMNVIQGKCWKHVPDRED